MLFAIGLLAALKSSALAVDVSRPEINLPALSVAPAVVSVVPNLDATALSPEAALIPAAVPAAQAAVPARVEAQLASLQTTRPQDAPVAARLVFDGAKAPAAAEPVAAAADSAPRTLAPAAPRAIFRRVKPAKWSRQRGFAKGDLVAYLGAACAAALAVGTVVFAFKISPWLGFAALAAFAFLTRSIARNLREQRAPKDISMPATPRVAPSGELPTLPELRVQLNSALDHLIRSQPVKNRDIGEIARGIAQTANAVESAGGFQGRGGWVSVDPRLIAAVEFPDILQRLLSLRPARDGIGPHTFFAKLDGLFDGLRAEARRAQSPEDLIKRLRWWPAHYRQFIP